MIESTICMPFHSFCRNFNFVNAIVLSDTMKSLYTISLLFFWLLPFAGTSQSVALDPSFAKKGSFYFSNGRYNEVKDVALTPDESLLVLIESGLMDSTRDMDVVVLKLTSKGIPDPNFGKNGKAQFDFHGMDISRAGEFKLLADGKILIAGDGCSKKYPGINLSCLAKILPNGSIDSSFGRNGTAPLRFDEVSYLSSLCVDETRSMYVAGSYVQPVGNHSDVFPIVGKVTNEGKPDSSFGKSGKIWIDFNFEIFSFTGIKHTAGGEISDILVQEDGKILVCGGFIFAYAYEGFVARFLPNGTLDKSFNKKGYLRYDFTPGKLNQVKKMILYDANTLVFGASSQTDFDSDLYFGVLNLTTAALSVTNIDFKSQHELFEDISVDQHEIVLTGRSISPENAPLRQQSNFVAIARIPDIKTPSQYESLIFPLSKVYQNGCMSHAVAKDKIVTAGFQHTADLFVKDVVISRFTKAKTIKKQ